jgi:hypothetical protein
MYLKSVLSRYCHAISGFWRELSRRSGLTNFLALLDDADADALLFLKRHLQIVFPFPPASLGKHQTRAIDLGVRHALACLMRMAAERHAGPAPTIHTSYSISSLGTRSAIDPDACLVKLEPVNCNHTRALLNTKFHVRLQETNVLFRCINRCGSEEWRVFSHQLPRTRLVSSACWQALYADLAIILGDDMLQNIERVANLWTRLILLLLMDPRRETQGRSVEDVAWKIRYVDEMILIYIRIINKKMTTSRRLYLIRIKRYRTVSVPYRTYRTVPPYRYRNRTFTVPYRTVLYGTFIRDAARV